jgi:hypothetical protein
MERLLTHPLTSCLFLLLSLALAKSWQVRTEVFADLLPENAATRSGEVSSSYSWLQKQLGILPKTAPKVRMEAFEGAELSGWDLLDSTQPLAVATQTELARWSGPGRLPLKTSGVSVTAVDGHPTYEIQLVATGEEPEVLAWLDHLLNTPTGVGYLTDPSRVRLTSPANNQVRLELSVRVWPAKVFLHHSISPGAN